MRFLGPLFLLFSFQLLADSEIKSQVHEIDYGDQLGDEIYILLKSGHVAKLQKWNQSFLKTLTDSKEQKTWLKITLDDNRYIKIVSLIPTQKIKRSSFILSEKEGYIPTTIANTSTAKQYFRESRRTTKEETQCFNRAMVWTYEWWKKHSLKSGKLLIFFTRNYIRKYNFDWWFHITPYVHILDDNGKVVERTMDVKYSSGPLEFKKWTDIFMRNNAACPIIDRYSQYADYPYSGDCFLIRTHMYTYQPADLQMYEAWNYTKDNFNMDEVKAAYLEAFDINL
ncbi:MAG: protein-glutamine glutaminase family protein [Bacteriovoracaceae bacterium]